MGAIQVGGIEDDSKWVEKTSHGFSKFVGFPIEGLEQQCMALLHKIGNGRKNHVREAGLHKAANTGSKGN